MGDFVAGVQARLDGLKGEAALNGHFCVSLGKSETAGRILVRLATGRELSVWEKNLGLAGSAGSLTIGSRVTIVGLAKAKDLNGLDGTVTGKGEPGRLLVQLHKSEEEKGEAKAEQAEQGELNQEEKLRAQEGEVKPEAKALKLENLVLVETPSTAKAPAAEDQAGFDLKNEREKKEMRKNKAAAEACPKGCKVRIHGLVEEKGRDNTGDPALNGQEGVVDKADFEEAGRLIIKLPPIKKWKLPDEIPLKSISYENLTRLDAPKEEKTQESTELQILGAAQKRKQEATELQILGAGGKRCKMTEIAIAGGDKMASKVASFASANRNRDAHLTTAASDNPADNAVAVSNALIYARTDVTSQDDEVAGAAMARLVQLCPSFAMKAICTLGTDIVANGDGKIGSKSSGIIDKLASWLTGGESDGILRKELKEGQACAGEADGIAACRRCAERGLKGDRLLSIYRKNSGNIKDFVGRGCKER